MEQKQNAGGIALATDALLDGLNLAQRAAVIFGIDAEGGPVPPLLIAAGAGTGKTKTLAHRVAQLIFGGADPRRLLLLTFTRRAALEMTRRSQQILAASRRGRAVSGAEAELLPWSGTFHSIGNRLLRRHAAALSLDPAFTVLDRADSADLMDLVRSDLGLARTRSRFPKKGTCLAIYSYTVNAGCPLEETLAESYPWCDEWEAELKRLFAAYVAVKQRDSVLDYDDLLLYWREAVEIPGIAKQMRSDFDHILVDEYQDTNRLQAAILLALALDGAGLTVVGDDAQSIYAFRAATVRNILDFPDQFSPRAAVISLEHNYRSTQPILDAANAVIARAREGFSKTLTSSKPSAELPHLVTVEDEDAQAVYVADQVLEHREAGSICATKPSCSAHHTTAHGLRSSWRAATSRSSNMAGSNSSRRRTSRTCWQCCAGQKTRTMPWPVSAFCNCCRGSGRPAQGGQWRILASTVSTSPSLPISRPRMLQRYPGRVFLA